MIDILARILPTPRGDHHKFGDDPLPVLPVIPPAETIPAVTAMDETQEWPAPLPQRDRCIVHLPPAPEPLNTTPILHRDVLHDMRRDYLGRSWDGLPIFRTIPEDRFVLHQLATRIPHTTSRGKQ